MTVTVHPVLGTPVADDPPNVHPNHGGNPYYYLVGYAMSAFPETAAAACPDHLAEVTAEHSVMQEQLSQHSAGEYWACNYRSDGVKIDYDATRPSLKWFQTYTPQGSLTSRGDGSVIFRELAELRPATYWSGWYVYHAQP